MTILCYHTVEPEWASPLAVVPEVFTAQCEWLARHRSVVPLPEALARADVSGRLPRRCTALTFDDGFSGLFHHALPTLSRLGLPATVFLVARTLTEGGRRVDWVDTPPPNELRTLDLEQVREMQAAGVDFQSHSLAHLDLTQLPYDECVRDLRESRELLESLLGQPVRLLAYPRGRHNSLVRRAAERAGYSHALALPEGPEPAGPYAVPRVGIYRANGVPTLRLKSSRWYPRVRTGPIHRLRRLAPRTRQAVTAR